MKPVEDDGKKAIGSHHCFAEDLELDISPKKLWRLGMSCLSKSL